MANKQSASAERFLIEPLSYRQTAEAAIAPAAALILVGIGLPILVKLNLDQQSALETLVQGGETLANQLGWIFPVIIAALLGFLAAAVTGNSHHSDPAEADRLRRVLGGTGLILGTAGLLIAAYVAIYAATSEDWALLIPLIPAVVLIGFLALFIGRYVAFSHDEQLRALTAAVTLRDERIRTLGKRSRRPWWFAILTSSGTIALVAAGVAVLLRGESSPAHFLITSVLGFIANLFVLSFGWMVLVATYVDATKTRVMAWAPALGFYLIVAGSAASALFLSQGMWAGLWGIGLVAGCLLTLLLPRSLQGHWLLNTTVNGSAAATAHRRLAEQQVIDLDRLRKLRLSMEQADPEDWLRRSMVALVHWSKRKGSSSSPVSPTPGRSTVAKVTVRPRRLRGSKLTNP
ncbi:hypothetical protein [Salinibacterium sp. GXW1014]|uniref:hypothetical protein n=1 Tax=Salinibacterium sp. GXW1014 TaxID=3377838 RepID=UPI00383BD793